MSTPDHEADDHRIKGLIEAQETAIQTLEGLVRKTDTDTLGVERDKVTLQACIALLSFYAQ